jgi:hypothetical protein
VLKAASTWERFVMPGKRLAALAVGFALATGNAHAAWAQGANFTVTAQVFQPITVVGNRTLAFGDVFPGVNKTVPVQGGNSGRFQVMGEVNAPISLTFTLPANLANGTNLLPIGSWVGRHNTTSNAATGVAFTPSGTPTNTTLSAAGIRWVYISGTVTPAANQAAGGYLATATLTVAYL